MVSHQGTVQPSLERPAPGQRLRRRIFVSSSNIDLFAHRAVVSRVLQTMDQQVIGMEHFGAQDGDATQVSLDELRASDLAVFIVAWRYGEPAGAGDDGRVCRCPACGALLHVSSVNLEVIAEAEE